MKRQITVPGLRDTNNWCLRGRTTGQSFRAPFSLCFRRFSWRTRNEEKELSRGVTSNFRLALFMVNPFQTEDHLRDASRLCLGLHL